ncbi:MAG: ribosome silencing factor [Stenomitos rutilans HA7619-LM2]|jgi:ribosome-associated protein|nr:ribosome silencing factor [Stenomitos rutilans HA7619-LM2]
MANYAQESLASVLTTANDTTLVNEPDLSLQLAIAAATAADERKAADITLLRVSEVSTLADYFVIVTGFSKAQVRAIAAAIKDNVEEALQRRPIRTEGQTEGSWTLQDYGDVIVHILMPQEREFYNLEAFWGHAERIDFAAINQWAKAAH